jgi:hypothetical protein
MQPGLETVKVQDAPLSRIGPCLGWIDDNDQGPMIPADQAGANLALLGVMLSGVLSHTSSRAQNRWSTADEIGLTSLNLDYIGSCWKRPLQRLKGLEDVGKRLKDRKEAGLTYGCRHYALLRDETNQLVAFRHLDVPQLV